MKNLVITINVPNKKHQENDLFNFAVSRAAEYAEKNKADFFCVKNNEAFPDFPPTWQRFTIFEEKYKQYDNILYIDSDLVLTKYAPNIFELMKSHDADVFASIDYETIAARKYTGYFNAGLLAFKRRWLDIWNANDIKERMNKWKDVSHFDQCCLNEMVKETRDGYINLGRLWNTMNSDYTKMPIVYGIHFIHYHKRFFNESTLFKYESAQRKISNNESFFSFPSWWKSYNFSDVIKMEKDFNKGIL